MWIQIYNNEHIYDVRGWRPVGSIAGGDIERKAAEEGPKEGDQGDQEDGESSSACDRFFWGCPQRRSDGVLYKGESFNEQYEQGTAGWVSEVIDPVLRGSSDEGPKLLGKVIGGPSRLFSCCNVVSPG